MFVVRQHPDYELGDKDEPREFYVAFFGVDTDLRCASNHLSVHSVLGVLQPP